MLAGFFFLCAFVMLVHRRFEQSLFVAHATAEGPDGSPLTKEVPLDDAKLLPPAVGDGLGTRQINLGETLKLDDLGPIIINPDGTTRRIANWANLTKSEQESSWRLISARNKKRIKALQEKAKQRSQDNTVTEREVAEEPKVATSTAAMLGDEGAPVVDASHGHRTVNPFEDELVADVLAEDEL